MRKERLEKRISELREEIVCLSWNKYKNTYTMSDLAKVFRMDLANFFRLLKKGKQISVIGKVVPDKKLGNKVIYNKSK